MNLKLSNLRANGISVKTKIDSRLGTENRLYLCQISSYQVAEYTVLKLEARGT